MFVAFLKYLNWLTSWNIFHLPITKYVKMNRISQKHTFFRISDLLQLFSYTIEEFSLTIFIHFSLC